MKFICGSILKKNQDCEILVERGFLWWRRHEIWRGWCTVWHLYPTGERGGTFEESTLCNFWQRIVWLEEEKNNE